MLKYTYRYDNFLVLFYRCCDSRNILRIMFAILTFAISIVDILTVHRSRRGSIATNRNRYHSYSVLWSTQPPTLGGIKNELAAYGV